MTRPLKERLVMRYEAQGWDEYGPAVDSRLVNPDGPEALARIERLEEALVQADLTIRSFPGADQSHVDFIRAALNEEA